MNYELAKELKDAGFPQDGEGHRLPLIPQYEDGVTPVTQYELCYVPTLSELIEACGKNFWSLGRAVSGKWFCCGAQDDEEFAESTAHHSTPEEAVARLWLALIKEI